MPTNNLKIVIIGAGAAGIAAASRLLENGVNDVLVLEAENRIGGRIHSVQYDGRVFELGAQWCHGEKENIVYEMAKDLDVLQPSYNNYRELVFYLPDGTIVDKTITDSLCGIAMAISDDKESAESFNGTYGDYFITDEFSDNEDVIKISELLLDFFHKFWMCYEAAYSWFDVTARGPFHYQECDGNLYLSWKNKGYETIFDILMKKIPDESKKISIDDKILLNKEVNNINWNSDHLGVTVTCSDGSSYSCDHVIVTVSLGVLKNMLDSFVPKLPPIKQEAIHAMAIGNVHKILLKFSMKWWPNDTKGFSLVWTHEHREQIMKEFPHGPNRNGRSWLEDILGFYVVDSDPNVLLGWFVGEMVEEMERLSDDLVQEGCKFLLEKFFGEKFHLTQINKILRSRWKTNPHFEGCYSYLCLEAEKRNICSEDLAAPVVNRCNREVLLFAGEATHSKYYSTVHGAIETGFREADRILKTYKSDKLIHRKVAIIGAGMAGLGAATTLHQLGCTDFIIVEAQAKPGGRIHTLTLDDNILELGAQWIHGRDNPVYEMAVKHGLLSPVTSEEGLGSYIRDNGDIVHNDIVKRVDFEIGKILSECEEFVGAVDYPPSVGDYMKKRFLKYLDDCDDSDEVREIKLELLDWHFRFQIIDNACLSMNHLSAKGWGEYICLDDEAHFNLKCGFDDLIAILVHALPKNSLLLSTPVAEIQRATSTFESNRIICDNGALITCDHLIITPSLGVLKQLKITPELPLETRQSIQRLGFSSIGKIYLVFHHKWWNEEGFQFVWRRNSKLDERNSWVKYITGFDRILHGQTVLLGWVGGEGVQIMENLSEEDVGRDCINLLRRFIRDRTIPDPIKVVKTRWCSNPWVLGAYSHISRDCDGTDSGMHKLSEPIFVDGKPRILIAGEAAHPSNYSTIHGAYESGQRQAKELADYIIGNAKL